MPFRAGLAPGASALAQAAFLGPFFAVEVREPPNGVSGVPAEPGNGEQAVHTLLADPAVLAARLAATRTALAARAGIAVSAVELKVAASTMQLGLAARLLSPGVGAVLLTGWLPRLTPSSLWWQPGDADPVGLTVAASLQARRCTDPSQVVNALKDQLIQPLLAPLVEATRAVVAVSRLVLWGNVASAVSTAVTLAVRAEPALQPLGRKVLVGILARPPLAGTSTGVGSGGFRRNSCCLLYRLPGAGICGDCVLAG